MVSEDVNDELRLAELDGIDLSKYVKACLNDSYRLGHIRKCIRAGVPSRYISPHFPALTLYYIRIGWQDGISMDGLLRYANGGVRGSVLDSLAEMALLGVDITRVDFRSIPSSVAVEYMRGLQKGLPMWLLEPYASEIDKQMIRALMRAMELGVDIHLFIGRGFSAEAVLVFLSYFGRIEMSDAVCKYAAGLTKADEIDSVLRKKLEERLDKSKD